MNDSSLIVDVRLPLDRFVLEAAFETTHAVTGIFGRSGSGKTSLLEAVAGIRPGVTGRIALGGLVWLDTERRVSAPPERRGVGYVPQDSLLFPHLDVLGNLRAGQRRSVRRGLDPDRAVDEVAHVLGLQAVLHRAVATLSGGERQRVALGRALCSGAGLLLLDEPTASLDAGLRRRVLPFLRRVQEAFGLPVLLVTHDPVEVQALCGDVVVLDEGRVVARGEPRAVFTSASVFPLAGDRGYENILPAVVVESGEETSRVGLEPLTSRVGLTVPRSVLPPGSPLLVGIPANEVILAVRRPEGLSARNVLPARIASISPAGPLRLVTLRLGDGVPDLVAEVTSEAIAELGLAEQHSVFVVVKTSSITLFEDPTALYATRP